MSSMLRRVHCAAFGVQFVLAAESEELLAAMRTRAPWGTVECSGPGEQGCEFRLCGNGNDFVLLRDGEWVAHSADLDVVLDQFGHELMLHVAECAPEHVFVHAGVVAWHRRGLVMPGSSFAGKTTLVAELVYAGARYYSDEYAVLDADGMLHPYPRALAVRKEGSEAQVPVSVETLGGVAGCGPVRASHVVFAEYVAGEEWRPEPMSSGTAVLEMLRHAVPVRRTPGRVMAAVAKMMEGAKAMRSWRAEANETARLLLAMMNSDEAQQ